MLQKTYGISFLVDWKAQINAGKARVIVHFTGGAITAFGVTPAEYTTSSTFFQRVIEGSKYFKEGRIALLRTIEVPDTPEEIARKARAKAAAEVAASKDAETSSSTEAPSNAGTQESENRGEDESDVATEEAEVADESENVSTTSSNKTVVNAACKEDVIEYLKINYNYTATSLRTQKALQQALADHNLEVVGVEL